MSSTQVSTRVQSLTRRRVRTALVIGVCAPIVAACSATGFGSPVRHAVANLQAATAKIGTNLEVQGVIIALPSGISSPKGGLAYLQFNAVNFANQQDGLLNVSAAPYTAASLPSGADSSTASEPPAAESLQAATDTTVPAATAAGPGTARISILLRNLTAPLQQGDTVVIDLTFAGGSVRGLLVPVQSAAVVGTFLPTAPPPAPASSPVASPVSSPVESPIASPVGSPAAGSSAPASAPVSSAPVSSAPASAPASPSAATSS